MIEIVHAPFGQEHPYEQSPEERFPREPLAGEPFTVGIAIRPPGAAAAVRVHTRLDGQPGPTVEAVRQADWRPKLEDGIGAEYLERAIIIDQDVWHAELTAPPVGHTLEYWIEAGGQTGAPYALRGEGWQAAPSGWSLRQDEPGRWSMQVFPGETGAPDLPEALPGLRSVEWLADGERFRRVRLAFDSPPGEAFYGLGQRYNAFDQRGNVLDIRCYDQYKNQGRRTYIPIPFLLSSRGYGLFVQSSRWMQFDLAASAPDRWTLEADTGPDGSLALTWLADSDLYAIVGCFTRLTGPAALPPLWAFGLWMSANLWDSQAIVTREVEQTRAHGIDATVLVIEAWSDEATYYIWNDAQYTPVPGGESLRYADFAFPPEGRWPDPKGMIDALHAQNMRLVLWQIPVLKALDEPHPQHDADRAYFEAQGFGVREADGDLYRVRPFWFRGGYLWDVTNPAAREWWFKKRAYLLDDLGVDGFKTDGGEHVWGAGTQFSDGRTGADLWNEYPQRYTAAYHDFAVEKRGGDALTFSRAGFVGSQRSPAHWAGDENSTWDAFRASIRAGLSAGISGLPFWGWDLGGFSGEIPTAELYLRAAAMAAFCPIMQYHSDYVRQREPSRDRTPWNIQARTGDERVIPTFRFFVNVRHNLMPYIWQEAQHAARTGQPMMRAPALDHPQASPYQYYFGRDLLVCPVVEEGVKSWPVFLPPGGWIDLWTGEGVEGGRTVTVAAPLDRIPVFIRQGATIPVCLGPGGRLGEHVPLTAHANAVLGA